MLFCSVAFLLFFPTVCVLYFLLPQRFRSLLLLAAGYACYAAAERWAVIFLLLTTLVTWVGGDLLHDASGDGAKVKRSAGFFCLIAAVGLLAYFKYVPYVLSLLGKGEVSILLPAGISFYTFQSLTYLMDCYRKECRPQKDFVKYALFVSFFPTILSGPIARAKNLLPQFDEEHSFDTLRAKEGLALMLWGYFLKMVIADRLAILTDLVYGDVNMRGLSVLIAVFAYSFQIYCDFAGYSYIAIGCAKIMGFSLPVNFARPYLATGMQDFWRRWHISLSSWFRDYLYIPLGGNRKGKVRKYINIMIVFVVSGIWHGANLTYLFWGFLHGIYQVIGGVITGIVPAAGSKRSGVLRIVKIAGTFLLMSFTWVFFRAPSVTEAFGILSRLGGPYLRALSDGTLFTLGLGVKNLVFVLAALVILVAADLGCERKNCDVDGLLNGVKWPVRWAVYYTLIIMILLSCNLSTQEFLYMKF